MTTRVSMTGITKHFDAVRALQGAHLDLYPGEVHTIAGENGSGKSTLLKILAGVIKQDEGQISIDGIQVQLQGVRDAMAHGITMVSQELSLVPYLSVAENVFLGHNQSRGKLGINWRDTDKRAVEFLKRLNLTVLLDEPTSSLAPKEVASLFAVVRQLRDEGVAVVMISHRMSEMLEISDRFTVLRDSKFIDTSLRAGVDENWLIERMVLNKPKKALQADKAATSTEVVMEVKGMTDPFGAFSNISFNLHKGEIVGLAGLAGAGRTELVEAIVGLHPRKAGDVVVSGETIGHTTRATMNAGVVLVPDDRRAKSTIHEMSIRDNLLLSVHGRPQKPRSRKKEEKIIEQWTSKFKIKMSSPYAPIKSLSGGNQQKVVIARCLETNPKVLILDEATRGIDLGAKAEIYQILRDLAKEGLSILVVSSELSEIFEISDRVLVMHAGDLTANLDRSNITESDVVSAATGVRN